MRVLLLVSLALLSAAAGAKPPPPPPAKATPPPKVPPPSPKNLRQNNGVRLVGGSGPKGRLEVSSKASWVAGKNTVGWRPVCDDGTFSDDLPQVFCELLGYSYGRRYYSPAVNYRAAKPGATRTDNPVGSMQCSSKPSRRLLDESFTETAVDAAGDAREGLSRSGSAGQGRALLSPLVANINTPRKAPHKCQFLLGYCNYTGPMVGLQCSHTPLPPAPSPPPSPPNPPPAPPSRSSYIRLVGGRQSSLNIEPNVCNKTSDYDCPYSRVELQVSTANGTTWAPLCAASNRTADSLARVVCAQVLEYPEAMKIFWMLDVHMPDAPYTIPRGPVTTDGYFDPAKYGLWATVTGGDTGSAKRVQDLVVETSASPCADGKMFAVGCGSVVE